MTPNPAIGTHRPAARATEFVTAPGFAAVGAQIRPGIRASPKIADAVVDATEVAGDDPGVTNRFGTSGVPDSANPAPAAVEIPNAFSKHF